MKKLIIILSLIWASQVDARYINGTVYDDAGESIPGVNVAIKGTTIGTTTDLNGFYSIEVESEKSILIFSFVGFETQKIKIGTRKVIDVVMTGATELQEVVVTAIGIEREKKALGYSVSDQLQGRSAGVQLRGQSFSPLHYDNRDIHNTEEYASLDENGFKEVLDKPLSTFSIDVDAASYSNMRRFIQNGSLPP